MLSGVTLYIHMRWQLFFQVTSRYLEDEVCGFRLTLSIKAAPKANQSEGAKKAHSRQSYFVTGGKSGKRRASRKSLLVDLALHPIGHLRNQAKPLSGSEVQGDLVFIQTMLLLISKSFSCYAN